MKAIKKKKNQTKENNIISFLNDRIKRINKNIENKKNKYKEAKNDLFSDKNFEKNISSHSKISFLIKK